jgi:hypothetical protein
LLHRLPKLPSNPVTQQPKSWLDLPRNLPRFELASRAAS